MDFELSEEQAAIRDMARDFAERELAPNALEWDRTSHFPEDVVRGVGELGFGGIYIAEDVGGTGLGRLDAALIFEALSRGCPSIAAFISIHNMVTWMIDRFGRPEQREAWCPRLCSLELIASYCLTEPNAGSDAAALRTRARRDGDAWVLDGTKSFISGGGASDLYLAMVRTGDTGPGGISAVLVEKGAEGLSYGAQEQKMGWKAQPTSEVRFDNCRIAADRLIGEEGKGFRYAMAGLDGGRLNIAACALGAAQVALEKAVRYANERKAFGQPISGFQSVQFKLADMETQLSAARIFLYQAASKLDAGAPDATKFCAMAKRFVTDAAFEVANEALQIHGGYGYLADYGLEKIVRDLRVHQILEGTNEIMRMIVGRAVLAEHA